MCVTFFECDTLLVFEREFKDENTKQKVMEKKRSGGINQKNLK